MTAVMLAIASLSQTIDDAAVLSVAREKISPVLKAPASAKFEIANKKGRPDYPAGSMFRGSVPFINDALASRNYMTVSGYFDAQNALGVWIRGSWTAFVKIEDNKTRVGGVLASYDDVANKDIYAS